MTENKMREKLVEDMECDELCFMESSNKELKEEAMEEESRKQCPPCNER